MPRDTAGGEDWKRRFSFGIRIDFTLLPCVAEQYRGETEETVVSRRGVRKIVVHSSQQREERTKKRRRGYRAFGFVAAVAVGVCGTRFARTVLALFPPSSLRLHRPIKAELTSPFSGFIQLSFFNPFVTMCHLPCRAPQCYGVRQGRCLSGPLLVLTTPKLNKI